MKEEKNETTFIFSFDKITHIIVFAFLFWGHRDKDRIMYVLNVFERISFKHNEYEKKEKNKFVLLYIVSDLPLLSVIVSTGRQDEWWWRGKKKKRENRTRPVYIYVYVQKVTWNNSFSLLIIYWPTRKWV